MAAPSALKKLLWTLKVPYLPEALKAAFTGPYTVDFPFGETHDTGCYRGATKWDEETCIGCSACAEVCPAHAIQVTDDVQSDPPMRRFSLRYDQCIFCGHCHYNCTTDDGIAQSQDWDLYAQSMIGLADQCAQAGDREGLFNHLVEGRVRTQDAQAELALYEQFQAFLEKMWGREVVEEQISEAAARFSQRLTT